MIETNKENISINQFRLYTTEACHLCDEANAILNDLHQQMMVLAKESGYSVIGNRLFSIEMKEITEDESLFEAYGKRIPVLIFAASGEELAWPFDIQQAYQFIFPKLRFQ